MLLGMHEHLVTSERHHERRRANRPEGGSHGSPSGVVRVAVVDDHAAIRLGLTAAIAPHPGLVCVGGAADGEEMLPLLHRTRPDVVVLDYHLPRVDGLELCRRVKGDVLAPAVLLYSAYADAAIVVPSLVAGADGMVHKSSPTRELFEAIRTVAHGGIHVPPIIPELLDAARAALHARDRPLLDLLVAPMQPAEIAAALGLPAAEVDERIGEMLARLRTGLAAQPAG